MISFNILNAEFSRILPIFNSASCVSNTSIQSGINTGAQDSVDMYVMNNYFGVGLDADVCLDFHMEREENPDKFNSRYILLIFCNHTTRICTSI